MSRGPGSVERAIMAAVKKEPDTLIPLWEIARDQGYDTTQRPVMAAWRRAANSPWQQDLIDYQWLWHQGGGGSMMCVRSIGPDIDPTDADRRRCAEYYAARKA